MAAQHFQFSVLIYRDLACSQSPWIVHCLNWDLVSQGDSPSHAIAMIQDAISVVITEDEAAGADPNSRPHAPRELWDQFFQTQNHGKVVHPSAVDQHARSHGGAVVITTTLYLKRQKDESLLSDFPASTPPPFMIDQIRNDGERLGL